MCVISAELNMRSPIMLNLLDGSTRLSCDRCFVAAYKTSNEASLRLYRDWLIDKYAVAIGVSRIRQEYFGQRMAI